MPRGNNRGGKVEGAGRKAGDRAFPAGTIEPDQPNSDAPPGGKRAGREASAVALAPRSETHAQAGLALYARGFSIREVARRLHKDPATVTKWIDAFPDVLNAEIRKLVDPTEVFSPMIPLAAQAYHAALEQGDTKVAQDVFDRQWGKAVVRTVSDSKVDIRISIWDGGELGGAEVIEHE